MPLAQRIATLPGYIATGDNTALVDASPGHRFQMYLRYWQGSNGDAFAAYKKCRPQGRDERATFTRENAESLKEVCPLGNSAKAVLAGLRTRQQTLIDSYGINGLRIQATSTAPFATGLGNEHPIENGFAFLTPYGLPYLAGSGVKGVLRHAAEEMALFPEEYGIAPEAAPSLLDIWWLFGFEGAAGAIWETGSAHNRAFKAAMPTLAAQEDLRAFIARTVTDKKDRAYLLDSVEDRRLTFLTRLIEGNSFRQTLSLRGALDCWDVFPAPAGNKLVVEIMTPHHAGYYMNGQPPHDAESPIPVPFLAVPALSAFDFHVVCASQQLPESLRATWHPLLQLIFKHAFDWLGFGAKTAVGYGAMEIKVASPSARQVTAGSAAPALARNSSHPQTETSEIVWPTAKLSLNTGTGEIKASFDGKSTPGIKGDKAKDLLATLGERANKLKKDKELKNVAVKVRQEGNLLTLLGLVDNP